MGSTRVVVGSRDPRIAGQIRADALEVILDTAARAAAGEHSDDGPRVPTELVNLTIPTGTPSLASLAFMGSVTKPPPANCAVMPRSAS
ncbi:hypothetical protein [Gordonia sp. NPDC003950]